MPKISATVFLLLVVLSDAAGLRGERTMEARRRSLSVWDDNRDATTNSAAWDEWLSDMSKHIEPNKDSCDPAVAEALTNAALNELTGNFWYYTASDDEKQTMTGHVKELFSCRTATAAAAHAVGVSSAEGLSVIANATNGNTTEAIRKCVLSIEEHFHEWDAACNVVNAAAPGTCPTYEQAHEMSAAEMFTFIEALPQPLPSAIEAGCVEELKAQEEMGAQWAIVIMLCFQRDSTALVPATAAARGQAGRTAVVGGVEVEVRRMDSLRAGDEVLVADEQTGRIFVDRVSYNMHVDDTSERYAGVTLHHSAGKLSVTDDHVMFLAGRERAGAGVPVAARDVKVGDRVLVSELSELDGDGVPAAAGAATREVQISAISKWSGGIINPVTHSGRILAGDGDTDAAAVQAGEHRPTFMLSSTVVESPGNTLLSIVSLPSVVKLASVLFPRQFQQSQVVGYARAVAALGVDAARQLQLHIPAAASPLLSMLTFGVYLALDVVVGSVFMVWSALASLAGAFAAGVAVGAGGRAMAGAMAIGQMHTRLAKFQKHAMQLATSGQPKSKRG